MDSDLNTGQKSSSQHKEFDQLNPAQQSEAHAAIQEIEKNWRRKLCESIPANLKPPGLPHDWGISLLRALRSLSRATPNLTCDVQGKLNDVVNERPTSTRTGPLRYADVQRVQWLIEAAKLRRQADTLRRQAQRKLYQVEKKTSIGLNKARIHAKGRPPSSLSPAHHLGTTIDDSAPSPATTVSNNEADSFFTMSAPPMHVPSDGEDPIESLFEIKIKRLQLLHQQRQHELDILMVKEEQATYRQSKITATKQTIDGVGLSLENVSHGDRN
jgi:hypothetical protein